MGLYSNMGISSTGLEAARKRLEAASSNLANSETSAPSAEAVYRPLRVFQKPQAANSETPTGYPSLGRGVISEVVEMPVSERLEFDPDHPDADAAGYVHYPDIDVTQEVAEMMAARRAYQAGLAAYSEAKQMFHSTLDVMRGA